VTTTAVITGSTRGIGLGLARAFLTKGANVVVSGRTQEAVDKALADLGAGARAAGLPADVTDLGSLRTLWSHALATFGNVDIWINNAGISHDRRPFWELPAEALKAVVDTNLLGTLHGSQVALAGFSSQGRGTLWNMEGLGSDGRVAKGTAAYVATKAGVRTLTKALLKEDLPDGVRVCYLSPGIVATDLLVQDYAGDDAAWEKAKKIFDVLGDDVGTVAPWLVDGMLASTKQGDRVIWLTKRKAAMRFLTAPVTKRHLTYPEA
jgi:NAD(P)-dependent dehydrogenase (short-subunit alcohol dehydrogenase family)